MIAFLAEALDVARGGGAERAIRATARALARRTEVAIFAPADRLGGPEPGVEVVGVPLRARGRTARARELARALTDAARARGAAARGGDAATLIACGKLLGADLVWSQGGLHAAARAAGARAGRSALGALVARAARAFRPVERVFDEIERENVEAARRGELRWIALSERVRRDLAAHHGPAPELTGRLAVVRNGVEVARFERRREHGERRVRALFVAHAFALKGLDRALRGLAHAPSATLDVVGRAPSARWERLARRLRVAERVRWRGAVDDLAPLLHETDVLLHPSRYDPCSIVVLEALAAAVPVIATREDGSSEIVGAGGFVLEDPDDALETGARLEALAEPATRAAMSEAARRAARSTEDVAADLLAAARRA